MVATLDDKMLQLNEAILACLEEQEVQKLERVRGAARSSRQEGQMNRSQSA